MKNLYFVLVTHETTKNQLLVAKGFGKTAYLHNAKSFDTLDAAKAEASKWQYGRVHSIKVSK